MASSAGFNALWLLCVVLLIVAFFLAIRRRRLAGRAEARRNDNPATIVSHPRQGAFIHIQYQENPRTRPSTNSEIRPPPPAFNAEEPPPSYQDFRKDIRIQPQTQ